MINRSMIFMIVLSVLTCFVLCPNQNAFGVVPAPDGGYPGGNTAEGQDALFSRTTGTNNTAAGWLSLHSVTTSDANTGLGAGTLLFNNAQANTATGAGALLFNTTGGGNTATGALALFANSSVNGIAGGTNTADGFDALFNNTDGRDNTAMGAAALVSNTTGGSNTAVGAGALLNHTDAEISTAIGFDALGNETGTLATFNIGVGLLAGSNVTTDIGVICLGVPGQNFAGCFIGNIWNQLGGSQAVYVNADGKLGFEASSLRFKDDIKPMEKASEVIYGLKPVSFRYKKEIEPTIPLAFGLIAEDVEKVSPALVTRDGDGKVNSVRYDAVNAMLLNEFMKQHEKIERQKVKIEEQQAIIDELKSAVARRRREMVTFTAKLKEQAARIQRVNAQIGMNKSEPQLVLKTQ